MTGRLMILPVIYALVINGLTAVSTRQYKNSFVFVNDFSALLPTRLKDQ
jgi:hypothetical protein